METPEIFQGFISGVYHHRIVTNINIELKTSELLSCIIWKLAINTNDVVITYSICYCPK